MTHAMTENHHDFTANSASHGVGVHRLVLWFVRGRRSNGTRWESGNRYPTKEQAEAEMKWWADNSTDTGEMNVWREVFPQNDKAQATASTKT
jgi:hypothetical protein